MAWPKPYQESEACGQPHSSWPTISPYTRTHYNDSSSIVKHMIRIPCILSYPDDVAAWLEYIFVAPLAIRPEDSQYCKASRLETRAYCIIRKYIGERLIPFTYVAKLIEISRNSHHDRASQRVSNISVSFFSSISFTH